MADEIVLRSGKMLQIVDERWVVRPDALSVQFVDLLTEARAHNGVVYLSFASAIIDQGNEFEASIAARLRMTLATAQALRDILANIINDALKPADMSKAN